MRKHFNNVLPLLVLASVPPVASAADNDAKNTAERLQSAARVVTDGMSSKDQGIPGNLLEKAQCAVVVPGMKKGGFIVGAKYGKGFATCRSSGGTRAWSAPAAIRIEGGSVGFQVGGSETDVILLVMNEKGAKRLLSSKFTLGGEGGIAAGPVGRNAAAQTDAKLTAEILSWSRSRGAFAGVSLEGATLREDQDENQILYGSKLTTEQVISGQSVPASARPLLNSLTMYPAKQGN